VLLESGRAAALDLYERYESGNILLIAPDILVAEFASLAAKRYRRRQISAEQAHQAFALILEFEKLLGARIRLRLKRGFSQESFADESRHFR